MKLRRLSAGQRSPLENYLRAGGVLDLLPLELDAEDLPADKPLFYPAAPQQASPFDMLALHQKAVVVAMKEICARAETEIERLRSESRINDKDIETRRIVFDITSATPKRLTLKEFVAAYYECFTNPPYSMQAADVDLDMWFHAINDAFFGGLSESLVIYEWGNQWSNYFDPGREWWGAYLWSIFNPGNLKIAVIAASTTD